MNESRVRKYRRCRVCNTELKTTAAGIYIHAKECFKDSKENNSEKAEENKLFKTSDNQ